MGEGATDVSWVLVSGESVRTDIVLTLGCYFRLARHYLGPCHRRVHEVQEVSKYLLGSTQAP